MSSVSVRVALLRSNQLLSGISSMELDAAVPKYLAPFPISLYTMITRGAAARPGDF